MAEHFFEPGAEYDDATGYSAPEIIRTADIGWGGTGLGLNHWRKGWNRTGPAPESEPSEGLKALAEANEREKAAQSAMGSPEPKPWSPCPDCLAPSVCEHGDRELCP